MNLFGPPKPPTATPTVSTEPPEPQLGFWQRNRQTAFLFGGCLILLLASRACNSREQKAHTTLQAKHVQQDSEREQSDKDGQISALHAQLFNAQQSVAAAKLAAEGAGLGTNPLTPAQLEQMAAAGGGALPPSTPGAVPGMPGALPRGAGYYNQELTAKHVAEKPKTLVISYRQDEAAASSKEQTAPQTPPLPPYPQFPPQAVVPTPGAITPPPSTNANGNPMFSPKTPNPEDQQHELAAATGEKYRIREGTWLPCTEQLRINGFFAGNINCLISIPIYSTSGAHLLIPQGTVALGHVAAVGAQSQQRLFVVFDELIMPDGYTVNYDNAAGLDQIGQTGLRDKVDHHYISMFGVSVGLAAIAGLSQIGNYGNSNITTASQYRSGVTQGLSESSVRILDKFTNVLPTFTIREGARNNIHLPFNLWLPDYSKHAMKGEL